MRWAATTESEQHKLLGAVSTQYHFFTDGGSHVFIDDAANDRRDLYHVHIQRLRQFAQSSLGSALVQLHTPAKVIVGVQVAQHEVCICHRRLGSTLIIAGRTWIGTRTLRANLDAVAQVAVDTGDGAAAGANGERLNHCETDQPRIKYW